VRGVYCFIFCRWFRLYMKPDIFNEKWDDYRFGRWQGYKATDQKCLRSRFWNWQKHHHYRYFSTQV
jgi:hypothetical protein